MIKFQELLILVYMQEYQDNYLFSEIKSICNFSTDQMKCFLNIMQGKQLLNFENNIISIAPLGSQVLVEKGLESITLNDLLTEKVTLNIQEERLSFDDIYIPLNFHI